MAIRSGDEAGVSRRAFLKVSAGGALALYVVGRSGGAEVFAAPIPGGTLAPGSIDKFVRPLVIPPAMPRSGTNSYAIAVRQFTQEILPPPLPQTTVWGYGAAASGPTFNYPSFTIEATRGTPVTVTWINELTDSSGNFRRPSAAG